MAPVDVARRAIEERAQQKRGLGVMKFDAGRRDDHNDDNDNNSHHHDDQSTKPTFPVVDITPASTTAIVASTTAPPTTSSITSFTTPETGAATTDPTPTSITHSSSTTIPSSTPQTTTLPLSTASSSSIAITSSSSVTITTTASVAESTSAVTPEDQPRKQGDNGNHHSSNSTTTITSATTSATALLDSSAQSSPASLPDSSFEHSHDVLSPTAEHLLIFAGTLGFVIMAAFSVWLVLRIRKNGGIKSLFKRQSPSYPPPYFPETSPAEKPKSPPRKFSAFYTPTPAPPPTSDDLALASRERQDLVRSALLDNPAPMGLSPAPPQKSYSQSRGATEEFYNTQPQAEQQQQQQQLGEEDFRINMYRASELSSLSSGFGDAKIDVPESGPSTTLDAARKSLAYRKSRPMFSHFSWGRDAPPIPTETEMSDNRDTIYTQASEAPRFRSIHSWVSQQTTRVERQISKAKNIAAPGNTGKEAGMGHRRLESGDPALRIHPGNEIEIEKGTRLPSIVLDTKVAM